MGIRDDEAFTRAKHEKTGAIAAISKAAIELGMAPGWVAVDGPLPEQGKAAIFPKLVDEEPARELEQPETPPVKSADTKSAKAKE